MIKKTSKILFLIVLVLLLSTTVFAGNNIWSIISEAGEHESNGELAKALPLWEEIITYFETQEMNEGNHTNIALFSKKLGLYLDSIKQYDRAVYYYEKENEHWLAIGKPWGAVDMLRAEEIRTIFETFVEVKATDKNLEKHEPLSGVYLGIYSENDKAIGQKFEKTSDVYGDHAIYILYQSWNQRIGYGQKSYALDVPLAENMKAQGSAFHVALNAMNGLDSVYENEWIIDWAKEANALDMPIFLRFLGEMNGDWVPWHGEPKLYIEKFRMVHDVMEEYAPNVAMVWAPNDLPIESPDGTRLEDYYPGDDYVDWVGVNFYNDYYNSGNIEGPTNYLANPLSHLDYVYDLYADKKPIMIGETGIAHYSIPSKEDLTTWASANLKKFYAQIQIKYPRVKAVNYFSLNQGNDNYLVGNRWSNYALSENKTIQKDYKELIQQDGFLGKITESYDMTYQPIPTHELKEESKVSFYVKITDYAISKVEFYGNDQLIAEDIELPFELETDFSKIDILTVKIYDTKGILSTEQILDLNAPEPVEETPQGAIEFHEAFVNGYSDGTFRANDAITRAEVATMLSRTINTDQVLGDMVFMDLENHWSKDDVMKLYSLGIVSGYDNQLFNPDQTILRSELAALLDNYVSFANRPYVTFYDQNVAGLDDDHWSVYAVRRLLDTNIFTEATQFNPNSTVTRGEVVRMINRLTGRPLTGTQSANFNDLDTNTETYEEIDAAMTKHIKLQD